MFKEYFRKKNECSHDDIDHDEYGSECKICGASGYEMRSGEYED